MTLIISKNTGLYGRLINISSVMKFNLGCEFLKYELRIENKIRSIRILLKILISEIKIQINIIYLEFIQNQEKKQKY